MDASYFLKNLAGVDSCDRTIEEELLLAGISVVPAMAHRSEVPYTVCGRYRNFQFTRAWRYWVVGGALSETHAKRLNKNAHCKEYVRVSGNAGGIENEKIHKHLSYFSDSGKEEMLQSYYDVQLEKYSDPESMIFKTITETIPKEYDIIEKYSNEGVITTYHIDTLYGLKLFVDFVKGCGV